MLICEIPDNSGYFVDSNGNVYSQWVNRGQHGTIKGSMLHKLKTSKSKYGHMTIRFGRKGKTELVHRLIYRIFIGEIPKGLLICHKDGDSSNNSINNLYAGSQRDNMQDAVKHGSCSFAKLNDKQVGEIISLRGKMMVKDIAFKFNVDRHTISNIYRGKSWSHITRKVAD